MTRRLGFAMLIISLVGGASTVQAQAAVARPQVIATIPVGDGPSGIALNPRTNRAYVANFREGTMSVIDGATNTVIATVIVGAEPAAVGVSPNTNMIYVALQSRGVAVVDGNANTLWVTGRAGNLVFAIDGATNTLVSTLGVGAFPTGITVAPRTNRVYTANQNNDTASVVDGTAFRLLGSIGVGALPTDAEANPRTGCVRLQPGRRDRDRHPGQPVGRPR